MERTVPHDAALKVVSDRYATATVAILAGSVTTGRATSTSDLDLVVLAPTDPEAAYREAFFSEGWPVEASSITRPTALPVASLPLDASLHQAIAIVRLDQGQTGRAGEPCLVGLHLVGCVHGVAKRCSVEPRDHRTFAAEAADRVHAMTLLVG